MSEHEPTLVEKVPFILWQAHLQSFFMGVLFFIAGYFAHGSLERRGGGRFLQERLIRLGLPTLFYMLAIHPFILLVLNPWKATFPPATAFYADFLRTGNFLGESGPLWFALALLIFCAVLVVVRAFPSDASKRGRVADVFTPAPSGTQLVSFAVMLGVLSFVVRLVWPIGTNVLNLQFCFFAQYIAAFAVGILAARRGWLLALASSTRARRAGWIALIGGPIVLLTLMVTGGQEGHEPFTGGWRWQALGYALWEQSVGVGLALGLMAYLSRCLNRDTPRLRWLSERCFGVYVLHAPVLVALMIAFRGLPQNPYGLIALLTLTGLVVSFIVADLARRIPGLKSIL